MFFRIAIVLFLFLAASMASAQDFPQPLRIGAPGAPAGPVNIGLLNSPTFYIVDATSGFGGFLLPKCSTLDQAIMFGATKADPTSNPILFLVEPGEDIAGFTYSFLELIGENVVLGCDLVRWYVISGSVADRLLTVNRTVVVTTPMSLGGHDNPRIIAETERMGVTRIHTVGAPGYAILPNLDAHSALMPAYHNSFDTAVFRTRGSSHTVYVCAPEGRSLNSVAHGCVALTEPGENVLVRYDGQEWHVQFQYKPSMYPTAVPFN